MDGPAYTPEPPPYLVACSDCGPDRGCCGLILPGSASDGIEMHCNECGFVLATVPTMAEAEETLIRMAVEEGVCSEVCTVCGETNVFTGFTSILLFTCRHCGSMIEVKRPVQ